jgi:hypothetical protein
MEGPIPSEERYEYFSNQRQLNTIPYGESRRMMEDNS